MSDGAAPFDREALRRHRARALRLGTGAEFLFEEVGGRLLDRLDDIRRTFPVTLEIGARRGALRASLEGRNGIESLIQADPSPAMIAAGTGARLAMDEELLPFADGSLDLVVSNLALHWTNDLPGALVQIRRALKPDGLLLAALIGGDSLGALRACLAEAEAQTTGGMAPRLSPLIDVRDAGALLQRAGFALPVVDIDRIEVSYADALALMRDLRAMGETNALAERPRGFARRDVLAAAAALYAERHGDAEGRITAAFDIVHLSGWAPAPGQQQPLRPGQGQVSLTRVLGEE